MKAVAKKNQGFTLIELIGVLAVMSILAAVFIPNSLRMLDSTAVRAERETLRKLGKAVADYVRTQRAYPPTTWETALTSSPHFAAASASELLRNSRLNDRRLIRDPAGSTRMVIISGMRPGISLPSVANLNTTNQFETVWGTAEGAVPGAGTGIWSAWATFGEYLVIERLNLREELQTFSFTLVNSSSSSVTFRTVRNPAPPSGNNVQTITANNTQSVTGLYAGEQIELYTPGTATATYIYTVSNRVGTFEFNGTSWKAQ